MGILKKTILYTLLFIILAYFALYLALPYLLNNEDYSKIITEKIQKNTGLVLVINDYKLSVAPNLALNLKAENAALFYPDKKQIVNIKGVDVNISTLYLLKKEVKIDKIKANELQFSTKLLKNGKTTFQEYIEKNIKQTDADFVFSKELPHITVNKYIFKIKDEESGQKFKISGNDFKITQNPNLKYLNIKTAGAVYCFDKKYVGYKLKIAAPKVLFKDLNGLLFDISVDNLNKYTFYADLDADVKINVLKDKFDSLNGKINIDNFSMLIGKTKLPPSYFHIFLNNGKADLSSKFYTNTNEITDISANLSMTKPYKIDMKCACKKADINNLQHLAISLCELLKIKNNLSEFKANGVISSDFSVRTDFKTLISSGNLKIKNADIAHKSVPLKITGINGIVDFSDNSINIKQSDILINNQPLKITGNIDSNAWGNIILSAENLDLNHIMNAFPALKPEKNLIVNSGKLSFSAKINGKLTQAEPQIHAVVKNLSAQEKINKIKISVREILIDAKTSKNKYSGIISLKDVLCNAKGIPNSKNSIQAALITTKFDSENLMITPSKINMGNAKMTLSGNVKNYIKKPIADILVEGTVDTVLIKSFAPQNTMLYSKGYLPVKAFIRSDGAATEINLKILSNPNNYITPIHINSLKNINTLTQILLKTEGNSLTIDDLSVYYAPNLNSLIKDVNPSKFKKAVGLKGNVLKITTDNPILENIKLTIPDYLSIELPELIPNLKASANVIADLTINGNIKNPIINGTLNLSELQIPQYFVKAQSVVVNLNKSYINAKIDNLKIKSMDLSMETIAPADFLSTNNINYLRINAEYLDLDYLMSLMPLFKQSVYSSGVDFPYTISSGKLNVKSLKLGEMKAQNITADISSEKNVMYLKNVFSNAYGGKTGGKITYNFPYSTITADIQGRGLDAGIAARDFMPQGQQISGKMDFDASLTMIGSTAQQQMKSLKGRADILINNAHLGPLGRFEHFLYAQNLLSQKFIYANINSAKQAIKPKDTGYVTYLKGMLKFNNGHAYLNPVLTSGPQMSMYITGYINLLNNDADLQILGRVSSEVSSSMGILGSMTIKDFLDEHTKYGATAANLFNFCNSEIPEMDISKIPALTPDYRYSTKNFRVLISGDTESVKSVKSFTWINPIGAKKQVMEQIQNATPSVNPPQKTLPESDSIQAKPPATIEPSQPIFQSKPAQKIPQAQPDFLNNIPDSFK